MGGFGSQTSTLSSEPRRRTTTAVGTATRRNNNTPPMLDTVALERAAAGAAAAVGTQRKDGRSSTLRTGPKGLGDVPSAPRTLLGL